LLDLMSCLGDAGAALSMTGARVSMGCIGAATIVLWLGLIGYIALTATLGFASSAILIAIIGGVLLSLWTLLVAWHPHLAIDVSGAQTYFDISRALR
jgi:hypothetical protein